MATYSEQTLRLSVGCDFQSTLTILSATFVPVSLTTFQSVLTIAQNPSNAPTLLTLTQTRTGSGSLTLGVQDPTNFGSQVVNLAGLMGLGPTQTTQDPPVPVSATTATLTTLAALSTTGLAAGALAFVQAGQGAYYAWSPGSTLTPNASTIIASTFAAGNWCLCGTVTVQIAGGMITPAMVGARWNLLVAWGDGSVSNLFGGPVEATWPV